MPQIPLYNKGLGASGVTTAGSLGPRASAGAFTGVGQEIARFGEAAGNIMRDFYDADKKAEAKSAIAQAENELTKDIDTHIKNDTSTSMEEFDGKYKVFADKRVKDIAGKYNLRAMEQQALIARLGDISAGGQLKGRNEAYGKQEVIRGTAVSDKLVRLRGIMASTPSNHPEHIKASADAMKEISDSQKDGTIKYSSIRSVEQLNIAVEQETFSNKIEGATSFSELKAMTEEVTKSKQSTSIKNKFNKVIRAKRNVLIQDINQNIQDQLDASDATFDELNTIVDLLRDNKDVNIELASGKTININGSDLPQNISNSVQKFISARSKEVEDDALNEISQDVSEEAENVGTLSAVDKAKSYVSASKDKEKAEGSIVGSAQYLYYRQKTLLEIYKQDPSQVNAEKIRELAESTKQLLQTKYGGRTSLEMQQTTNGKSARAILSGVIDVENDLIEAQNTAQFINNGVTALQTGRYSEVKQNYTAKQEKAAISKAIKGKSQADTLLILQQNNVAYENFKNELSEGATNILGDQGDMPKLKNQIELFRQMKAMGPGLVQLHLNQEETAVYNQVLALEQTGKTIEESIGIVNAARKTGIETINAKYKVIKSEVDSISSESTSFFGTKPQNSSVIQQKVENLSKIYIGLGADPKAAVERAGQDILDSHINHKGVLIPRSVNMNETDIRYYADLIIKDYKLKNPDDDEEITATPVTGRIDRWSIVRNGMLFPNESYTLDQLKKMKLEEETAKAEVKKKEVIAAQFEKQKDLVKSPEDIRKEKIREEQAVLFKELTTTDFQKGMPEKTAGAIAEEKRKEKIRKENIKTLKETLLGPKLQ